MLKIIGLPVLKQPFLVIQQKWICKSFEGAYVLSEICTCRKRALGLWLVLRQQRILL